LPGQADVLDQTGVEQEQAPEVCAEMYALAPDVDGAAPPCATVIFFCSRERLAEPAIAAFHDWLEGALRQ
jgi:hypothetical protein